MPRKKNEKPADAAVVQPETEAARSVEPMVTIVKTGTAAKLSPRGDGKLTYQIGRMGDAILVRIFSNESSGRFSKEWVGVDAIRQSLAQLPKGAGSFKGAIVLKSAWKGRSSCQGGFAAAIMRAENVFANDEDPKKKGMLKLAAPDALDAWEKSMLALKVPKDAEQVLLNPPKPVPNFAKPADKPAGEEGGAGNPDDGIEEERAPSGDEDAIHDDASASGEQEE